jgi:hypothetical protein
MSKNQTRSDIHDIPLQNNCFSKALPAGLSMKMRIMRQPAVRYFRKDDAAMPSIALHAVLALPADPSWPRSIHTPGTNQWYGAKTRQCGVTPIP